MIDTRRSNGGVDIGSSAVEPKIEATYRNSSLTAISVLLGFSLSFLSRWASLTGAWTRGDMITSLVQ